MNWMQTRPQWDELPLSDRLIVVALVIFGFLMICAMVDFLIRGLSMA